MAILPTVLASFGVMLCLGGVYAWSLFVPGLIEEHGFTAAQTQLVFGVLIAVFPATMVAVGQLPSHLPPRLLVSIAGLLFGLGYLLAAFSGGEFWIILVGIGFLAGVGTGFGYLTALTVPVRLLPARKGLLAGVAAGGFGLAAVVAAYVVESLLTRGWGVLPIFAWFGTVYGLVILLLAFFVRTPVAVEHPGPLPRLGELFRHPDLQRAGVGIFAGTFAGLLIIGSLNPLGAARMVEGQVLVAGVSVFAVANFCGRMGWGALSDWWGARPCIIGALALQGLAIAGFAMPGLSAGLFLFLSFAVGFGFGGNFVLFARDIAQSFGVERLGKVYPWVLLGYALAGIAGPFTGGWIYDLTGSYTPAVWVAAVMSLVGASVYLIGFTHTLTASPDTQREAISPMGANKP